MKNSLWIIIALVTGIIGFLAGYSVSGFTGARGAQAAAQPAPAPHDGPPAAGGYGGARPAPPPAQKVASDKPKAAGY